MTSTSQIVHVAPVDQPHSVHEIAKRLFAAYTIDEGSVHLAGCTLEDRLFARCDLRSGGKKLELYLDAEGRQVSRELVDTLGMDEVAELERPPQPFAPQIERLTEVAARLATAALSSAGPAEVLGATVVWCKYTQGKLRFVVGEASAELAFSGWSRTLRPPPFVCPYTGTATFHLAATDDGRIAAAEQIEPCAETGRRMLVQDLVTCSVTGRRAIAELMGTCPVTGERLLRRETVHCDMCRQPVSPTAMHHGQCAACRDLQPVSKADPRMARVLDEHRPLDRWRSWRISETETVYVLLASGWLRRLLVVVDKHSLDLKLLATGSRLVGGWREVEPAQYQFALRE